METVEILVEIVNESLIGRKDKKGEFNNWVISLLVMSLSNISHIAYLMRYLVLEKSKG